MDRLSHDIIGQVKQAIREPYAWPGGYPVVVVMADGELMCPDCAKSNFRQIVSATKARYNDGWKAAGASVNWEGADEHCCNCNAALESAYGETENNEEE